jgi:hypothetical protein
MCVVGCKRQRCDRLCMPLKRVSSERSMMYIPHANGGIRRDRDDVYAVDENVANVPLEWISECPY